MFDLPPTKIAAFDAPITQAEKRWETPTYVKIIRMTSELSDRSDNHCTTAWNLKKKVESKTYWTGAFPYLWPTCTIMVLVSAESYVHASGAGYFWTKVASMTRRAQAADQTVLSADENVSTSNGSYIFQAVYPTDSHIYCQKKICFFEELLDHLVAVWWAKWVDINTLGWISGRFYALGQ